ncbi:MAG: hypothetical protein OHK0015_27150 [Chloroflexi bacterium OHK40]
MLRLIILLGMLLALAACGTPTPTPRTMPAEITGVEVEVLESQPVQVVAFVSGGLGDGCTSLGPISQARSGSTIELTVNATHSGAEACTMIYQTFEERIPLEGEFAPGQYTLIVNGSAHSFTV